VADAAPSTAGNAGPACGRPIRVRPRPERALVAVASRSHPDAETEAFLSGLSVIDRHSIGSSLKFCRLAEGKADVYARIGPTMEWAAGGRVRSPDDRPLRYGKVASGFRNGEFVAWGG